MNLGRLYKPGFYGSGSITFQSASVVLQHVFDVLHPTSIVDIGCGPGYWLRAASDLGVEEILGVDGDWVLQGDLQIARDKFLVHDLTQPLNLGTRFDLALSIEVGEHLLDQDAAVFVRSLCAASDRVLFSAAIPNQGGSNHVNEQWPLYWYDHFSQLGYDCYDVIRPVVWNNPRVSCYYAQNCLLFAKPGAVSGVGSPTVPQSLVHPDLWMMKTTSLQALLRQLPNAVKKSIRRRVSREKNV